MGSQVASTMGRAMRLGDLRRRILITIAMFAVFRLGVHVPVPGINTSVLPSLFKAGTFFGVLNLFSGGALGVFAIFAMGVTPYINASIIMQLLQLVIPQVEEWSKEGAEGQKQINRWTRYGTLFLGLVQAIGLTVYLRAGGGLLHPGLWPAATVVVVLVSGTILLMWIGEQITEYGIGNGISLLIFAGIVSRLPQAVGTLFNYVTTHVVSVFNLVLFLIIAFFVIAAVVAVTQAARRVPVHYAKRVVGRRMYGGASSYIPLRVNQAGVIPVIFALSVLTVPLTLGQFFKNAKWLSAAGSFLTGNIFWYEMASAVLVIAFTFFYTNIVWNPTDVADNIRKQGGFIPGLRPGRPTAEYLTRVLGRITILGAIFLAAVTVLPAALSPLTHIPMQFGGTALLIVVGVALDTMMQIEGHMLMRHYQGFIR